MVDGSVRRVAVTNLSGNIYIYTYIYIYLRCEKADTEAPRSRVKLDPPPHGREVQE